MKVINIVDVMFGKAEPESPIELGHIPWAEFLTYKNRNGKGGGGGEGFPFLVLL